MLGELFAQEATSARTRKNVAGLRLIFEQPSQAVREDATAR
jgi:hypothetical protein